MLSTTTLSHPRPLSLFLQLPRTAENKEAVGHEISLGAEWTTLRALAVQILQVFGVKDVRMIEDIMCPEPV